MKGNINDLGVSVSYLQGTDLRIRWRRVDLINSRKGLHGVSILV
jgi:hypothetical protein